MPKLVVPLSDSQCKKLRYNPVNKAANRIRDGRGLLLEALPSLRRVWRFEYKIGNKRSAATFPYDYGSERGTLSEARKWREENRALLVEGIDPNKHAKQLRASRLAEPDRLFKTVAEEWISFKEDSSEWGEKQQKKVTGIVRNYLVPALGERPVAEITSQELLAVLQAIKSKGNAKLGRQFASAIFRRSIVRGLRQDDPTIALRGAIATPESKEQPHLEKPGEVGALLRDIDKYQANNFSVEFILKLSPLLFLRPTELREAVWEEFNFQTAEWVIPKERMKTDKALVVPLSKQVITLLEKLAPYSHHSDESILFPSPMGTSCLLYTSPSPRDGLLSRMPSSA